ncbi:cell cycle checkpoint protein RAD17 [Pelomyxa schiedti]|nr:cell cycle checkpoint protein RAD17 [Pelomyxa schiedti]
MDDTLAYPPSPAPTIESPDYQVPTPPQQHECDTPNHQLAHPIMPSPGSGAQYSNHRRHLRSREPTGANYAPRSSHNHLTSHRHDVNKNCTATTPAKAAATTATPSSATPTPREHARHHGHSQSPHSHNNRHHRSSAAMSRPSKGHAGLQVQDQQHENERTPPDSISSDRCVAVIDVDSGDGDAEVVGVPPPRSADLHVVAPPFRHYGAADFGAHAASAARTHVAAVRSTERKRCHRDSASTASCVRSLSAARYENCVVWCQQAAQYLQGTLEESPASVLSPFRRTSPTPSPPLTPKQSPTDSTGRDSENAPINTSPPANLFNISEDDDDSILNFDVMVDVIKNSTPMPKNPTEVGVAPTAISSGEAVGPGQCTGFQVETVPNSTPSVEHSFPKDTSPSAPEVTRPEGNPSKEACFSEHPTVPPVTLHANCGPQFTEIPHTSITPLRSAHKTVSSPLKGTAPISYVERATPTVNAQPDNGHFTRQFHDLDITGNLAFGRPKKLSFDLTEPSKSDLHNTRISNPTRHVIGGQLSVQTTSISTGSKHGISCRKRGQLDRLSNPLSPNSHPALSPAYAGSELHAPHSKRIRHSPVSPPLSLHPTSILSETKKCALSSTKGQSNTTKTEIWFTKYSPVTEEELVVNPKKVADVKAWLVNSFKNIGTSSGKRMLCLTGPSGSGKTAMVHILSKSVKAVPCEWVLPSYDTTLNSDCITEDYTPVIERFMGWLRNTSRTRDLLSGAGRKILVVEDFPHIAGLPQANKLREALRWFLQFGRMPLVFIMNDVYSSIESSSLLYEVVSREFFSNPGVSVISVNPVTATMMEKILRRVALMEGFPQISNTVLSMLAENSGGDIRTAINALQFYCCCSQEYLSPHPVNKSSIGNRDQSLNLLHAVGKIIYCKRIPQSQLPSKRKPMHANFRLPLKNSASAVLERVCAPSDIFTAFVHENYLGTFSDIDDIASSLEFLSFSDTLEKRSFDMPVLTTYSAQVASQGFLFFNNHHINKSYKQMEKPQQFTALKNAAANSMSLKQLCYSVCTQQIQTGARGADDYRYPDWLTSGASHSMEVLPWVRAMSLLQMKNNQVKAQQPTKSYEEILFGTNHTFLGGLCDYFRTKKL